MKRSIRASAFVALCAVNQNAFSAKAFSPMQTSSNPASTPPTRPLHMVSTLDPVEVYSAPADARTDYDISQEEELLRQIGAGIQKRQQQLRESDAANLAKRRGKEPKMMTTDVENRTGVRIIRSNPKTSGKVAQMTQFMPTESLTASPANSGRLLTLTKEEEGVISDAIQDMREILRIRKNLQVTNSEGLEIMPTEVEWADACGLSVEELLRIISDGTEGRSRLVAANTGLVTSIAKRHYATLRRNNQSNGGIGTILTLQDLVQEGNLGLMMAAERFDPSKGFRFSTYASYWIRQRISRSIAESSRVIRLPAHVHSMLGTIKKTEQEMEKELGHVPSITDVAGRLGLTEQKVKLYSDASRNVLSLEVPLNAKLDDKRTLGDKIASKAPTPNDDAEFNLLRTEIREAMESLTERERQVLTARYGLGNFNPPLSVDETARNLGISRDRCRTIQARALHKLRHPNRNYRLKEFVGDSDAHEEAESTLDFLELPKQAQPMRPQKRIHVEPVESPESMWGF